MVRVVRLPKSILEPFWGVSVDAPTIAYGGIDEAGNVLAAGGFMWDGEGRCILWFDAFTDIGRRAALLVWWGRRVLRLARQLGEQEVYLFRDEQHASSERLVRLLGFELCGVAVTEDAGKEIYSCRVWKP